MIAIITYDTPHRKTQDIITKLIMSGYSQLKLVVIPWVARKNFQPLYQHRPTNAVPICIEELTERFKIEFDRLEMSSLGSYFLANNFQHIIIGGAGILPESLSKNHKVINAHPGFLPNMKGLDAFKWAILKNEKIGVTTHYISEKADEGTLIEKREVASYFEDSFYSLAVRVYETEIEMIVNSIQLINTNKASFESLSDDTFKANMRMPHHYEIQMIEKYDELRRNSPSRRDT
jgi:phosphoribosylglycinamide formyltransferase-1|tara:strand:+ start:1903 stop:2601 length:699 start_codon:yes stop_codon:yes gene_type:complete